MPIGVARLLVYLRVMRSMPRAGPLLYLNLDIRSKRTDRRPAIFADFARSAPDPDDLAAQTGCKIYRDTPRNAHDTDWSRAHFHTNAVQHDSVISGTDR